MEGVEQQQNGNHPYKSSPCDKSGLDVMVDVVDADGNVIGPVGRIKLWNQ